MAQRHQDEPVEEPNPEDQFEVPDDTAAGDHEALLLEALSQIPQPMSPEEVARLRTDLPPIAASDDPATFEYFPD